jgi:hypothetical protein
MLMRSTIVVCVTTLVAGFFILDLVKSYARYEFLVKGDVCIAFDRKEKSLKVVGINGVVTIPFLKTTEQQMREQIEAEVSKKIKKGLLSGVASPPIASSQNTNMMSGINIEEAG